MHVVFATLGSVGDLYPMIAVASLLRAPGCEVTLASSPRFADACRARGLRFSPIGADADPAPSPRSAGSIGAAESTAAFIEHQNFRHLDRVFDDLDAACVNADLLVAPYFVVAAHLVAERRGIPFVSCAFSPAFLLRDTAAHATARDERLRVPLDWHEATSRLRKRVGLPPRRLAYFGVFDSPVSMLGAFPAFLAGAGPFQVPNVRVVGYPHLRLDCDSQASALTEFCDRSTIAFSFGTHVDRGAAEYLFEESRAACRTLGLKCVYLSEHLAESVMHSARTSDVMVSRFAAHDVIFPRVRAVVHHAGIGTLMAACRSAVPMVCVPFFYDQPFNAGRLATLLEAPVIPQTEYGRGSLIPALRSLLSRESDQRAAIRDMMSAERDGAAPAANHLIQMPLASVACR